MNICSRPRGGGKTRKTIEYAARTDARIVCASVQEARRIEWEARKLGLSIKQPISYDGAREKLMGDHSPVIVDNADWLLRLFLSPHVEAITVTGPTVDIWNEPEQPTTGPMP